MKKTIAIFLLLTLAACNTVEGAGQDIKGAGQWTADSAHKVKEKIDGQ